MKQRPKILSISFSDIRFDSRVLRQLAVLSEHGDVTTVGYGSAPAGSFEHVEIPRNLPSLPQTPSGVALLAARQFRAVALRAPGVKKALALVPHRHFDLIVANEARALPLAHAVSRGAPIWGDMHEWAPEERSNVLVWRVLVAPFMRWVCKTYLPGCAKVTTVNVSIAKLYDEQFGVNTDVVRNSRPHEDAAPSTMEPGRIRLVHSGVAVPDRGIETLISAVLRLDDRFSLDLYLVTGEDQSEYGASLRTLSGGSARITFHDAVLPHELIANLNQFDVGVFILRPATTNHRLMLPNKFFDFVQARLAVVFSPAVETDRLIRQYDLGSVTQGWEVDDLMNALETLTVESVAQFKENANNAAVSLSSVDDEATQHAIVTELLEAAHGAIDS